MQVMLIAESILEATNRNRAFLYEGVFQTFSR